MSTSSFEQPAPVKSEFPYVWDLVIKDIQAYHAATGKPYGRLIQNMRQRDEKGVEKYGLRLQPDNGRDPIRDLLDEILDGIAYSRQAIEEGIDVHGVYSLLVTVADYIVDRFEF